MFSTFVLLASSVVSLTSSFGTLFSFAHVMLKYVELLYYSPTLQRVWGGNLILIHRCLSCKTKYLGCCCCTSNASEI